MGPPIPGNIPWEIVERWCQRFGYNDEQLDFLDRCFGPMDMVFIEWWNSQLPKDSGGNKGRDRGRR